MTDFYDKKHFKLANNKDMIINDIYGIDIEKFRLFEEQQFNLGENITVVSGRNGTMKSTLMGLLAQPYRTSHVDLYGKLMQTKFSEIFKLSSEKDKNDYLYFIRLNIDNDLKLREPIPLYFQKGNPNSKTSQKDRHRLVPSGRQKGDGYFTLPSVYINLKRLYPLIDLGEIESDALEYDKSEKAFISNLYQRVLLRKDFDNFEKYSTNSGSINKKPYGPESSYYDVNSISSGEDNLSTFADILISFMRVFNLNKTLENHGLTGILSIDEFEASLHPVAQLNLFDFLYDWSKKYKVKIILNTHSLYLIQKLYLEYEDELKNKLIILNFIASQFEKDNVLKIIENPKYNLAYSELTLSDYSEKNQLVKVKILCEDEVAELLLKRIIKKKEILSRLNFSHVVNDNNPGTSFKLLISLCRSFPNILKETMSMVVLDADVDSSTIKLDGFNHILTIPSLFGGLPFEKEIVYYILNLDGDNDFFKKFKKTKEMFRQLFVQYKIPLDINSIKESKTKYFKNWYSENKTEANKYMTYYVNDNKDIFGIFLDDIIRNINEIRTKNGFNNINI